MRTHLIRFALLIGLISALVSVAAGTRQTSAASHVVTFVSDVGGLNDKGFNHLGWLGTTTGAAKVGWTAKVIETINPTDYAKNLTAAARQSQVVIAVGFSFGTALPIVAAKFPKVDFVIIDYDYKDLKANNLKTAPTNILGNDFTPEQSSYLAGIVAAGISKTHKVGFVGGLNVPLIVAFYAGFRAGALHYDPHVTVMPPVYTGSFVDQSKGKTAGLQEINAGADVIYPAAGASGLGALAAANQRHVWGIGVDSDQNFLYPHTVITSVVKHVEVAVASAIVDAAHGKFRPTTKLWNLANNGVGLASYHSLASDVPAKVKAAVAQARAQIIAGKIMVPTTYP